MRRRRCDHCNNDAVIKFNHPVPYCDATYLCQFCTLDVVGHRCATCTDVYFTQLLTHLEPYIAKINSFGDTIKDNGVTE